MSICESCGSDDFGGMSFSEEGKNLHYCFRGDCQKKGYAHLDRVVVAETKKHKEAGLCGFHIAWVGLCDEEAVANGACVKHGPVKCRVCGAQATRECEETGQFVCGECLCKTCPCPRHGL